MTELNPNHPVTQEIHDHWRKIAFMLMRKISQDRVIITPEEVELFANDAGSAITIRFDDTMGIVLRIVNSEEADRLARSEGGLPI